MKLLLVVQRYGPDVIGGSEGLCRALAQRLAARHEVSVATSCATDYVTWANALPPGISRDGAVTVHRFPSARQRPLQEFWRLSDRLADDGASEAEQQRWFRLNGPELPGLLAFLQEHGRDYDRVLFFTFRYAPSWFGLPLVAERAILVPTAEDDGLLQTSTILAPYLRLPRAFVYMTPEERHLLEGVAGGPLAPSVTIGTGIAPAGPAADRGPIDALSVPRDFLLYVGRVDRNKGCDALVRHYAVYADAAGAAALPLILAGPLAMHLPAHPGIRALGRVSDAVRDSLLSHARALVMPSPYESLSIVVLEAWNRATPVIVNARCTVLLGQVRRADGGLYYRTSDEFAAAVAHLAAKPDIASALGARGLAYVEREYRWPLVMERLESVLAR